MSVFQFRKFQISLGENTKKIQGLEIGDIVRRQFFDGKNSIYSLMSVIETGVKTKVSEDGEYDIPYFVGALLEGDAPTNEQLLDFARITNLFNVDRLGAIYLTAVDSNAPYLDIVDGIGKNKSLCWPEGIANAQYQDSYSQYVPLNSNANYTYSAFESENSRICSIIKNTSETSEIGISQDFFQYVENPDRVLISYKIKASKQVQIKGRLAYSDDVRVDGEYTETIDTTWRYRFHAITVDWSGRHLRKFVLTTSDLNEGEKLEIADFNIILQSSISNFQDAPHTRIGKLDGVYDPVLGQLSNYGSYVQKLYATNAAHISGTLTAGDENGFASTFYAGKIHKNAWINSISPLFLTNNQISNKPSPVGIGNVYSVNNNISIIAQKYSWLKNHRGQRHNISFWIYVQKGCQLTILQNNEIISTYTCLPQKTNQWIRVSCPTTLPLPTTENDIPATIAQWSSAKTPYAENSIVYMHGNYFQTNKENSLPPLPIAQFNDGKYIAKRDGGYILAGSSQNPLSINDGWAITTEENIENEYGVIISIAVEFTEDYETGEDEILITAPQLELGIEATQYQPTDSTLNYTEDYGAWFNRGGIGGTIQNPLLQLNFDGEGGIGTRSKSFLLRYDGSGYLANQNIKWDQSGNVVFGDNVSLSWGNIANSPDWINEWDSNKTLINGEYIITPKIFAGKKIDIEDGISVLTGIYIGPTGDGAGIYGYKEGIDIFHINETEGRIAGWVIDTTRICTEDLALSINAEGSIVSQDEHAEVLWGIYKNGEAVFAKGNVRFFGDGSAYFKGNIEANAGLIANWNVLQNLIHSNNLSIDSTQQCIALSPFDLSTIKIDENFDHKEYVKTAGGVYMHYISPSNYGINGYLPEVNGEERKTFALGSENLIAGWQFDVDAIWLGTKINQTNTFADEGSLILGSAGLRGHSWYIDVNGEASFLSGDIIFGINSGKFMGWTISPSKLVSDMVAIISEKGLSGIYVSNENIEETPSMQLATVIENYGGIYLRNTVNGAELKGYKDNELQFSLVSKGISQIAGWFFNTEAIYTGEYVESGFTNNKGSIVISKTGLRGYYWKFEPDGSGALVRDKIYWDAEGNITFNVDIDASRITSGYISVDVLDLDEILSNKGKWALRQDGSGFLASNNLSWDANGYVTMTGRVFQIDSITQQPIPIPVDKLEWQEGERYAFYDRVSYKGALWLCVNPEGTDTEPYSLNPDWLKQVSEGQDGELLGDVSRWDITKAPYTKGKVVSFANSLYVALTDTSNPPIRIAKFNNGKFMRKKDGGYILAGRLADKTTHEDWELVLDGNQLKGENTITADIDNEMVACPLSPEGKTLKNQTWEVNVKMWNGYTALPLSEITVSPVSGFNVSVNSSSGKIIFSIDSDVLIAETNKFDIILKAINNNHEFVRNLAFTVSGVKSGANGEDAVIYSLSSSSSVIQVNKKGETSPAAISCTRYKTVGSKREVTTEGELKYNIDGNGEIPVDNNFNIDSSYINKNIKFTFYIDGKIVDVENVPKISDGADGVNGDSLTPSGRWESSKTPYAKGSVVLFAGGSFVALVDTSNPPLAIAQYNNGNYVRKPNGDYILAGKSSDYAVHPDWQTVVAPIKPSAIYWLESPITAFGYSASGSPTPSSVQVSCKMSVADYTGSCNMLWLVARKSNDGSVWIQHVVATQAQSINISAPTGYTQVLVRAYKSLSDANNWNEEFVCEKGIGVVTDGATGATGATGAMPRDRGVFVNGAKYEWNSDYRDKVIHLINGVYYNFLVKNYGSRVTSAPSSIYGDSNWEVMNKYISIATDTLFADGANVAGFMFKNGVMRSQRETGGVANMILNGQTGYFHCNNVDIKGKIIADSGVFNGTVNADGGVFQNITIKKNINSSGDNFYISDKGEVVLKGEIIAQKGSIGGINIENGYIGTNYNNKGLYISNETVSVRYNGTIARIGYDVGGVFSVGHMAGYFVCNEKEIDPSFPKTNVGLYVSVSGAKAYDNDAYLGNHALYIPKGDICGFRLRTRRISEDIILGVYDSIIIAVKKDITIKLGTQGYEDGQIYYIRNHTDGYVNLYGRISNKGYPNSDYKTVKLNPGDMAIVIYDIVNNVWTYNYVVRSE